MKALTLFFILSITFSVSAKITEKDMSILTRVEKEKVELVIKKTIKDLNEIKKEAPSPTTLLVQAAQYKIYQNLPYIEADTGIQRKWFNLLVKSIDQMVTIKTKQKQAWRAKKKKEYFAFADLYDKAVENFVQISKKPIKIDRKRLLSLKKEAKRKRNEIEKKLEQEGFKLNNINGGDAEPDRRGTR